MCFLFTLDEKCVTARKLITLILNMTPEIEAFFEAGMQFMELGVLLDRGKRQMACGYVYRTFYMCDAKEVPFETLEGYETDCDLCKKSCNYLTKHGWEKRVLFHIPMNQTFIIRRRKYWKHARDQYYLAAGILRKYIPGSGSLKQWIRQNSEVELISGFGYCRI